jgi:hypothetical protein
MEAITDGVRPADRAERDRVLTACLLAAVTVGHGQRTDPGVTLTQLSTLFGIAAFHAPAHFLPAGVNGFIDAVTAGRLADLLPEPLREPDDDVLLLDAAGRLTTEAEELLCEHLHLSEPEGAALTAAEQLPAWAPLRVEQVERRTFGALRAAGDDGYRAGRAALIRHPAGTRQQIAEVFNRLGGRVDGYDVLPAEAVWRGWWLPCPVCRWPMHCTGDIAACRYRPHRDAGAAFALTEPARAGQVPRLTRLGGRPRAAVGTPTPRPATDAVAVNFPVWRYVVVPGITELHIADRLGRLPGATVVLWPELDRYDLDIRLAGRRWCVDVKDWHSAPALAAALTARPTDFPEPDRCTTNLIVVSDHHGAQVPLLAERLPRTVQVTTASGLVKTVRAAARRADA